MRLEPRFTILLATIAVALWPASSRAQGSSPGSDMQLETSVVDSRVRLLFAPELSLVSRQGSSLKSVGMGVGARYGLSPAWACGVMLRQGLAASGLSSTFTAVELRLTRALTGELVRHEESIKLGGTGIASAKQADRGGLRAELALSQYFFNGTGTVVPLGGPGLSLSYELAGAGRFGFAFGIKAEQVTNGRISATSAQLFGVVLLWM